MIYSDIPRRVDPAVRIRGRGDCVLFEPEVRGKRAAVINHVTYRAVECLSADGVRLRNVKTQAVTVLEVRGYFEAIGDLLVTGPTNTNVNDFRALLVL